MGLIFSRSSLCSKRKSRSCLTGRISGCSPCLSMTQQDRCFQNVVYCDTWISGLTFDSFEVFGVCVPCTENVGSLYSISAPELKTSGVREELTPVWSYSNTKPDRNQTETRPKPNPILVSKECAKSMARTFRSLTERNFRSRFRLFFQLKQKHKF